MLSDIEGWSLGFTIIVGALVFTITVFWIFVPFAIFGIKPLLRELIDEQKRTNQLLAGGTRQ